MQYFIIVLAALLIVAAVMQSGGKAPIKAHKRAVRRQSGHKIDVNVNGRKVRTITVKAHTRVVGA